MSHWFHRNPLKATAPVSFNLYGGGGGGRAPGGHASGQAASRLCGELRTSRARLLEMFADVNGDAVTPDGVRSAADEYFSLLQGFVVENLRSVESSSSSTNDGTTPTMTRDDNNELRFAQKFKWTDTLLQQQGNKVAVARRDAVFELASMAFNVALWHTKHAARAAAKERVTEAQAADVHRSLRTAAGIFAHLGEVQAPRLQASSNNNNNNNTENNNKGLLLRDLEPRVLHAYATQCLAEAQEVTIARAVALGHEAGLVAALALHTSQLYGRAEGALQSALQPQPGASSEPSSSDGGGGGGGGGGGAAAAAANKWRKYLQLKQSFYAAYAHCYHGQTLLAADRCGESIACLRKAEQCYGRAQALCRDYRQTRGAGGPDASCKPSEQLFFLKLGGDIESALAKSRRENDFIYFHRVPAGALLPPLQLQASHGVAEPVAFGMPPLSALWATPAVYGAFRLSRRAKPPPSSSSKPPPSSSSKPPPSSSSKPPSSSEEEVRPVKENNMKPQKDTGCVVS